MSPRRIHQDVCSCGAVGVVRYSFPADRVIRRLGKHTYKTGKRSKTRDVETCLDDVKVGDIGYGYQRAYAKAVNQGRYDRGARFADDRTKSQRHRPRRGGTWADYCPVFWRPDPRDRHKALAQVLDVDFEYVEWALADTKMLDWQSTAQIQLL